MQGAAARSNGGDGDDTAKKSLSASSILSYSGATLESDDHQEVMGGGDGMGA